MGTLYLLYFLKGPVHYKHPDQGLLVLILIYTICVVLTAVVGGMISDRIGKRKMIVTLSGALQGVAALLLVFVETWPAAMVAAVLFGAGFGAYLAVDQALITQVLPAAADRAKDLGIINIAIVAPERGRRGAGRGAGHGRQLPHAVRRHGRGRGTGLDPGLADQERAVATWPRRQRPHRARGRPGPAACSARPARPPRPRPRPPRRTTRRPRGGSAPPPAAARATGTARMYQVSSTVGAQPVAPRPNTTGGRPSTARASR